MTAPGAARAPTREDVHQARRQGPGAGGHPGRGQPGRGHDREDARGADPHPAVPGLAGHPNREADRERGWKRGRDAQADPEAEVALEADPEAHRGVPPDRAAEAPARHPEGTVRAGARRPCR